ncbi:MAG TPA: alpha/beta-type small acid-soluble spore protein [Bacillota bacterium]|nr:alpha/beta-type small acid-soluble spore protein [Bacillota bacterium]HNT02408.1 alpha/beta-type small acid-soluble spore protein [Bacillota bacterium]HPA53683.1 alpha/beta-type small acid-soluble spore protein [Bacillota bacterium]HPX70056.1 alpha/beta-type small acid-soluble spore protein [Bacillota bacterium]HQA64667.1 alpha/beta-type small acid-soluble spore protein [Bacillota bacterium]
MSGKRTGRRSSKILVPEAEVAMDTLKKSIASEFGIDFNSDYKGNLSAKQCGKVGGEMVRRIIEQMKQEIAQSPGRFRQ